MYRSIRMNINILENVLDIPFVLHLFIKKKKKNN